MSKTVLMVGTRKGCFLLESDEARRDWTLRGPFCEGWPIYHVIRDADSGSVFAAAASEWHGSSVWRSADLGETWEQSSEGLSYENGDLKLSKVSGLTAAHGRLFAGAENPASSRAATEATWSPRPISRASLGARAGTTPPTSRRATSACRRSCRTRTTRALLGDRAGGRDLRDDRRRRHVDAAQPRPARRLASRPRGGRLLRAQARDVADGHRSAVPAEPRRHAPQRRRRPWTEITEGLPTEFGFAAAAHPHDRDTFYVIPLDPGHARCMPDGKAAVWRTRDAGSSWQRLDDGLPQQDAHVGVLREGMAIDGYDEPGVYFGTSTGQVFASADEGDTWTEIASYLPGIASVEVAIVD